MRVSSTPSSGWWIAAPRRLDRPAGSGTATNFPVPSPARSHAIYQCSRVGYLQSASDRSTICLSALRSRARHGNGSAAAIVVGSHAVLTGKTELGISHQFAWAYRGNAWCVVPPGPKKLLASAARAPNNARRSPSGVDRHRAQPRLGQQVLQPVVNEVTPLTQLQVRVQDTDLSSSLSGVAVAFDQQPTSGTGSYAIDLGGGALGSKGRNCIFGGAIYNLKTTGFDVSAAHNWWGSPSGPVPGKILASAGGSVSSSNWLTHPPSACNQGKDQDQ